MDKKDNSLLLISKYILDSKQYNKERTNVSWETSYLRSWLNEDFYSAAFSENERKYIRETNVKAEDNPYYGTDAGKDTVDKIFVLSVSEAKKYLTNERYDVDPSGLMCKSTSYAIAQGNASTDNKYGSWDLRTPGIRLDSNTYVVADCGIIAGLGKPTETGTGTGATVNSKGGGIRPAMWISLE